MDSMRGQVMLEFILIATVAIIIGTIYLTLGTSLFIDTTEQQRIDALNDIGYAVQDEVILASQVADGYERVFMIPERADRFTYVLSNDAYTLTLVSGATRVNYDLPNITGSFQKGTNVIRKDGFVRVSSS
jgi:hypothetical protein